MSFATDPGVLWMQAYRAGDASKFSLLLAEYQRPVLAHLHRMVRNRDDAEDLAQEVFLRVHRSRHYEPTAKFQSWLFRIATNLARNWVRDHRAEQSLVPLDRGHGRQDGHGWIPTPPSPAMSVEERLIRECRMAEVRAVLNELPEHYRAAVLLHKYSEMEYEEIAVRLNCSLPALKSRLFRAYEILRTRLAHLDPARYNKTATAGCSCGPALPTAFPEPAPEKSGC
jgi:RNA polymerase sigma-70 factor, ECF subfamily